ncbi:hypothetical protein [Bacillus sp. Marseille-P3800]|uniref:hypothetical protein n=1 Tax=Bacillus sp. Marseille-P3800 TaxID=2014782 RepID=UPI000C077EA8|nr:hypothetical protein [Bacillus sp. Marseille-P3800]
MNSYTYKDPTSNGYRQISVSKKKHNELIRRKLKWHTKAEYYYSDNRIKINYFTNVLGIAATVILIPFTLPSNIALSGVRIIPEYIKELKDIFKPKKRGAFITDTYSKLYGRSKEVAIYHALIEAGRPIKRRG